LFYVLYNIGDMVTVH